MSLLNEFIMDFFGKIVNLHKKYIFSSGFSAEASGAGGEDLTGKAQILNVTLINLFFAVHSLAAMVRVVFAQEQER